MIYGSTNPCLHAPTTRISMSTDLYWQHDPHRARAVAGEEKKKTIYSVPLARYQPRDVRVFTSNRQPPVFVFDDN